MLFYLHFAGANTMKEIYDNCKKSVLPIIDSRKQRKKELKFQKASVELKKVSKYAQMCYTLLCITSCFFERH